MKFQHNMSALVGNTPMIRLDPLVQKHDCLAEIVMKLEYFNPGGSIKDRIGKSMVEDAESKGLLIPGSGRYLVEPTTGNTGLGLAFMAIIRGYKLIIVMPENMSEERKALLRGMGVELVLTSAAGGMIEASAEAERIVEERGALMLDQSANPANVTAHYTGTGPEIWAQCGNKVDIFVTGIGTGGTVTGAGRYLKECNKNIKVYGVEPAESPLLSEGRSGPHLIQGIGSNREQKVLDRSVLDGIIQVSSSKAIEAARELILLEGVFGGISSGANAYAAIGLAKKPENRGKRIVCIAPDTAERYLSTKLFQD
jgi:cysteine synthase A